ncbi:MAG: tRNA (N(6)-L-threonylcarbamoyladenosine(37)-C(2))-methylthiotransferase MtaB [Deltaproteobacteria bacterium]|nr:tRNA (N(6)-L-threonylcarbamoyladenosine(37)-C(2))-methylthiotransferase MtaB [Deltaproteobacteria bacterium]
MPKKLPYAMSLILGPRVLIETLGCKVNHYESQGLASEFRRQGWQVVKKGPCEAVVINSCAVTAEAARQSLQAARRALKRYPEARVALAGCAVVAEPQKAAEIESLEVLCGNAGKKELVSRLTRQLEGMGAGQLDEIGIFGELEIGLLRADCERGRSRAVVKIQDGCNAFCRYCIIPYLRGRCRSLPPEKVLAECRGLAAAGFREVVLTGIHIGRYGEDVGAGFSLTSLLLQLVDEFPDLRLRLGSLQPHEITPEITALLHDPQSPLCEHLHLSLQSASDRVLGAMGRPYRRSDIEKIFALLDAGSGRLNIGTDLIVGFPAEDERAFRETLALVEKVELGYLHVFPYSPRQGTVAASWPDRVAGAEKKARAAELGALGRQKREVFITKNLGHALKVLLENGVDDSQYGTAWFGHSRNYLPVLVTNLDENDSLRAGSEATVRAYAWDGKRIQATLELV